MTGPGAKAIADQCVKPDDDGYASVVFSFDSLVPTPPQYLNDGRWYAWRIQNWGTKWNADLGRWSANEDSAEFDFLTAWSPPLPWLETVSRKYPDLRFEIVYFEPGVGFAGRRVFEAGEPTEEDDFEYGDPGYRPFVTKHFGEGALLDDEEDDA